MEWCEKLTRFYGFLLKVPQNKRLTKSIFGLNNKPSKAKITWGLKYTDEDTPVSVFIYCILISPDSQLSTSYKGGYRVPIKHIHCFCSHGSLIMLPCHSFFYNSFTILFPELWMSWIFSLWCKIMVLLQKLALLKFYHTVFPIIKLRHVLLEKCSKYNSIRFVSANTFWRVSWVVDSVTDLIELLV